MVIEIYAISVLLSFLSAVGASFVEDKWLIGEVGTVVCLIPLLNLLWVVGFIMSVYHYFKYG